VLERVNEIADPRKVMPGTVLRVPTPSDKPRVARASQAPPSAAKFAPPPIASSEPRRESSTAPPIQPSIINSREAAPTEQHKRVASLGQGMTDASPPGAPEPTARATDAPQRDAALSVPKIPAPAERFRWPARGKIIANFGNKAGAGPNDGINILVPRGTEVHAAESGVVTYAGDDVKGYGNLVIIRHPEGWITAYAHNDSLMVKSGENVRRGQVIAKAGNTGSVAQPQLHFQVRQGATATPVDPTLYLER
jgi:murein DD-endopeptidase MepM/ murein hydrolase activator NlpD